MRLPKFQFSLRTLLIVMTVACVYLAVQFQWAREQREAVEAIRESGGNVYYDYQGVSKSHATAAESWAPRWAIDRFGIDFFHTAIQAQRVRRGGLPAVAHLRKLQWLEIEDWQVTDEDLQALRRLQQLQILEIHAPPAASGHSNTMATDQTLALLGRLPHLRRLKIDGLEFSDAGAASLLQLPELEAAEIYAYECAITPAGVEQLKGNPSLLRLETSGWNGLMVIGTGRFDRTPK
jgi:hypothetical protein